MVEHSPPPRTDLPALWAEYKELTSRRLPERSARFVRSRRFDRLLLVYALYSCVVLAIAAIGLFAGAELLDRMLGWSPQVDG
jgi:hypothetical protein